MAASEIEKLERLVKENPKGRLFASLADAYRKDGQYPKALEVLEAGLKNHPDYVSARVVLGRVHLSTGDKAGAREAFAQVVALDPESVIALKALADLAEEEGQGEEALRWSGQLLTVDPGNDEAIKQQERLAASAPAAEVRLSGVVPIDISEVVDQYTPLVDEPAASPPSAPYAPARTVEITIPAFPSITARIPPSTSAPSFSPALEPMAQEPEPLPLAPLSEEAQTEAAVGEVAPMAALEPTSFEDASASSAPTQRMAGLESGMSEAEVAGIGAAAGFEPTSGPQDVADLPRSSLLGLESLSGELVSEAPMIPAAEEELERQQDIVIGASASNEFQESSAAETLRRRSGANEFQVSSDADTLDAASAHASEAIETGGMDLAFIEAGPGLVSGHGVTAATQIPEDPEPAVAEPEPVVTEAMAELYASQGHLVEALDVYRQLAGRSPEESRFTDRIVELEMFVGGSAPTEVRATAGLPMIDVTVDEPATPPAVAAPGAADSLEEMELVPMTELPVRSSAPHVPRVTVGAWLADIFADSLPSAPAPEAPLAVPAPAASVAEVPMVEPMRESDVAPRGAPTRPASGNFSLNNVFGEERPSSAVAKAGSFDDFFGATKAAPPAAPVVPSGPGTTTPRSTRLSASSISASDDDLPSFQDWLKGLKK